MPKALKKYDIDGKAASLIERGILPAAFFFAFTALELWGYSTYEKEDGKDIIMGLGAIMFFVLGLSCLFPKAAEKAGDVLKVIGKFVLWLIGIGIGIALLIGLYALVAAMPVSLAVIIGAIIIASALRR